MKKLFAVLILLVISGTITAQNENDSNKTSYKFREPKQNSFGRGEKLLFDINYLGVNAGDAIMEVAPDFYLQNGRNCLRIKTTVKSKSTFWVYKLFSVYECDFDAKGLFPWRFEQNKTEGKYREINETYFDQENHKAKTLEGAEKVQKGEYDIPEYVQDQLSAFYYSRTLDFTGAKENDIVINLQTFYKDKTYPLQVQFLGYETIDVNAGKFKCIKVKPIGGSGGLFGSSDDLIIWLTDDAVRMPVKVNVKIKVGSFNVELKSYENVFPLNSKVD
jgi:hypothetical protein